MTASARIEKALDIAFQRAESPGCPRQLIEAMRYAVFPRGARVRPRLLLAVAQACGEDEPALVDAAAASIELLHCASLVHDDLPCFDDAALRRGKPSVHKAFDERIAVLTGDALIVLAFQTLAQVPAAPVRLAPLVLTLARAVGMPLGIIAGQAWECEPAADLSTYHRQKTGSLFAGAAMMGAAACGADPNLWRDLGETLGQAYQAADDIGDAASDSARLGKPIGQDKSLGRPSLVGTFGLDGAMEQLESLVKAAIGAIPPCPGAADLKTLIVTEAMRLVPAELSARAA